MKKIKTFDCGPCLANVCIELYAFDNKNIDSLAKVAKLRNQPQPYGKGSGVTSYSAWAENKTQPIRVFVNTNRKSKLTAVFRTIPHEIDHIIGRLSNEFEVDSGSEPMVYLCGSLTETFQKAMLKELGYKLEEEV